MSHSALHHRVNITAAYRLAKATAIHPNTTPSARMQAIDLAEQAAAELRAMGETLPEQGEL